MTITTTTTAPRGTCPVGGCDSDSQEHYAFGDGVTGEVSQPHGRAITSFAGDNGDQLEVCIEAYETRAGTRVGGDDALPECEPLEGSEATFSKPLVTVYGHAGDVLDDLTATEARQLAEALTRAAEQLEDLGGAGLQIAETVCATMEGLGVTDAEMAQAAGLTLDRLTMISCGSLATHAERRAIADGAANILGRAREQHR